MVLGDVLKVDFFGMKQFQHFKGKLRIFFKVNSDLSGYFSHVLVFNSKLFKPDDGHLSTKEFVDILRPNDNAFEEILLDLEQVVKSLKVTVFSFLLTGVGEMGVL